MCAGCPGLARNPGHVDDGGVLLEQSDERRPVAATPGRQAAEGAAASRAREVHTAAATISVKRREGGDGTQATASPSRPRSDETGATSRGAESPADVMEGDRRAAEPPEGTQGGASSEGAGLSVGEGLAALWSCTGQALATCCHDLLYGSLCAQRTPWHRPTNSWRRCQRACLARSLPPSRSSCASWWPWSSRQGGYAMAC